MFTVHQALARIIEHVSPRAPLDVALADALGLVLAQDVVSDGDSPPFDKSMMDGYAVRTADIQGGAARLEVIEEVTAGRVARRSLAAGQAIRIMTGAPIPDGADAVVRLEDTRFLADSGTVAVETRSLKSGTHIIRRGTAMRAGERILPAGRRLRAQELGCLAELGLHVAHVHPRPTFAVLATGDELTSIDQTPGPGQIRNSNETMLVAQATQFGCVPVPLGIARDDRGDLEKKVRRGLESDILCLSGGVSAGKLDLVPSVLQAAGVREVFHKVDLKPGKPVWFGVLDRSLVVGGPRLVFGLPGNPVSSMVCCELFVRTAVRRLMGCEPALAQPVTATLTVEHPHRDDRPTYFPSRLEWTAEGAKVTPVSWHGSSDLRSTVEANAMTLFPAGERTYAKGERVEVFPWSMASCPSSVVSCQW
jgi:molybdopterin molybdotransferase